MSDKPTVYRYSSAMMLVKQYVPTLNYKNVSREFQREMYELELLCRHEVDYYEALDVSI